MSNKSLLLVALVVVATACGDAGGGTGTGGAGGTGGFAGEGGTGGVAPKSCEFQVDCEDGFLCSYFRPDGRFCVPQGTLIECDETRTYDSGDGSIVVQSIAYLPVELPEDVTAVNCGGYYIDAGGTEFEISYEGDVEYCGDASGWVQATEDGRVFVECGYVRTDEDSVFEEGNLRTYVNYEPR
jgi:hypothetical protein